MSSLILKELAVPLTIQVDEMVIANHPRAFFVCVWHWWQKGYSVIQFLLNITEKKSVAFHIKGWRKERTQ